LIGKLGWTVLRSPPHSPKANAICERRIGTIRRECLDWLIPLSESHLRSILRSWVGHYNRGRPDMALGPGVPDPPTQVASAVRQQTRHRISECLRVRAAACDSGSTAERPRLACGHRSRPRRRRQTWTIGGSMAQRRSSPKTGQASTPVRPKTRSTVGACSQDASQTVGRYA
jgi:hypothetical protein